MELVDVLDGLGLGPKVHAMGWFSLGHMPYVADLSEDVAGTESIGSIAYVRS
jgi:hypothetical protein